MSNVVGFAPSPLTPYLGEWLRDPISVSRHKVSKRLLGADGLRRLWACRSIAQMRELLASDPQLAERYAARLAFGGEGRLVVTRRSLTWQEPAALPLAATERTVTVAETVVDGRGVIVRLGGGGAGFKLRMTGAWLLVSEIYHPRPSFPPSPVFRYYRGP